MTLCLPAAATVVAFTFNPNAASPSLAGAGTAFTADTINYTNNVYSVVQSDGTFLSHRILVVTGFSLNGAPVAPTGFGSAYGLYFDVAETGISARPAPLVFSGSTFTLRADPGNQNGVLSSTFAGIGFSNTGATGVADDITLATGSSLTATAGFNPATGIRTTHLVETVLPAAGEGGFFVSPLLNGTVLLDSVNTTNPGLLVATPGPNGTTIQTINGGFGVAQFVPEPGSILLLGTGLLGLVLRRGRPRG